VLAARGVGGGRAPQEDRGEDDPGQDQGARQLEAGPEGRHERFAERGFDRLHVAPGDPFQGRFGSFGTAQDADQLLGAFAADLYPRALTALPTRRGCR